MDVRNNLKTLLQTMLEKLKSKTNKFEFVEFDNMELRRDGFLISGENPNLIEEKWCEWFEQENSKHPNNYFDYIHCYFDDKTNSHLQINLLLDRSHRFHSIKKIIPKSKIHCSFITSYDNHQYIVVDKDWFNFIRNSMYSTYALIDFIGVRKIISDYGEIPQSFFKSLKLLIDEFAIKNPTYDFLTCADNIIVKTNWLVNENINTYSPESFTRTIHDLMNRIEVTINLKSYTIITQGANYVNENGLINNHRLENHYFMPSISEPFIDVFEIDTDARKKIKNNEIKKSQFYLENSFYISLKRKYSSGEEPEWVQFAEFTNSKNNNLLKYLAVNFEELSVLTELKTKE